MARFGVAMSLSLSLVFLLADASFAESGCGNCGKKVPGLLSYHAVLFDGKTRIDDIRMIGPEERKTVYEVSERRTGPPTSRSIEKNNDETVLSFVPGILPSGRKASVLIGIKRVTMNAEKKVFVLECLNIGKTETFRFSNGLSLALTVEKIDP